MPKSPSAIRPVAPKADSFAAANPNQFSQGISGMVFYSGCMPVVLNVASGDVGVVFLGDQDRLFHPEILDLRDVGHQLGHGPFIRDRDLAYLQLCDAVDRFHHVSMGRPKKLLQSRYLFLVRGHNES